jgi:hypothetical protein
LIRSLQAFPANQPHFPFGNWNAAQRGKHHAAGIQTGVKTCRDSAINPALRFASHLRDASFVGWHQS